MLIQGSTTALEGNNSPFSLANRIFLSFVISRLSFTPHRSIILSNIDTLLNKLDLRVKLQPHRTWST